MNGQMDINGYMNYEKIDNYLYIQNNIIQIDNNRYLDITIDIWILNRKSI